jgi:ABC-type polysaccharide/polyol phosphate export permease
MRTLNLRPRGAGWLPGPPDALTVTIQQGSRQNLLRDAVELVAWRHALVELVARDLKVRYRRSVLGQLWSMLNPLLTMAVTAVVFSSFFRFAIDNFPIYVLTAQLIWAFFAQATVAATTSVLGSSSVARRVYVPAALFPLATIVSAGINLLLAMVPLFLIVLVTSHTFTAALLFLPIALALVFLFSLGLGLLLSAASVFFHDVVHTIQVLLSAWMYLTPIFYPIEIVPETWSPLVQFNPMYHLVELFRTPIYAGALPDPSHIVFGAVCALVSLVIGWWYFERSRGAFAGYL